MKVTVRFDYDESFALALGNHYGEKRATMETVRIWAEGALRATAECIQAEYEDGKKPAKGKAGSAYRYKCGCRLGPNGGTTCKKHG